MGNSVRVISNDSEPKNDRERAKSLTGESTSYTCAITLTDAVRFGFSCLVLPVMVAADVVQCVKDGKDLRRLVSSELAPARDWKGFVQVSMVLGAVSGVGVAALAGNVSILPICIAAGALGMPVATMNGLGGIYCVLEGVPMAFRGAARRTLQSRAYKALKTGAPKLRGKVKEVGDKPICRLRIQGPK